MDADAEDWAAVLRGDGAAFARIFDRRKSSVRRQVRRLLDRPPEVEDAVAVVFLETWRRRSAVRLVDGSLLPWLLVTATNVARNARRSALRYDRLLARLPVPTELADPASSLDDRHALQALRGLSLADQQVLTLCVLEGWPERDAALVLGIAPGTVKSRLHRAKQRLAHRIGETAPAVLGKEVRDGA